MSGFFVYLYSMIWKINTIFFLVTITHSWINAQTFISGNIFSSYTDIIPDTTLNYVGPNSTESYSIDINNDLQNDFKVSADYVTSGATFGGNIQIQPLNANSFCRRGRIDSVYVSSFSWWWATSVAKPLFIGDTINSINAIWDNSTHMLTCQKTTAGTIKYITDWISTSEQYIGIKHQNTTDTIYGWIRVNIPAQNNCKLKDYSFNFNSTGIQETVLASQIIIHPNPTNNILYITNNKINFLNSKLEIINSIGQTVLKTDFKNQIDVSELASGFYTLLLKDNSGTVLTKKFLKE